MLKCSLSGETPPTDPVVTPSGRICSRRLLLSKLTENGGRDPFDPSGNRTLDESDLIALREGSADGDGASSVIPPRLPSAGSLPSLLGLIQAEYDSALLELYDARRALEETRRELSQALYQNDAAVRVVARLAAERDAAREKVRELSSRPAAAPAPAPAAQEGPGPAPPAAVVVEEDSRKRRRVEGEGEAVGPAEKPAVVEPDGGGGGGAEAGSGGPSEKIPKEDVAAMEEAWTALSKERRKAAKEKKAKGGPAGPGLADFEKFEEVDKKSLHRTNVKAGIHCLAISGDLVVSGGRDKQAIVYDRSTEKIVATLKGAKGDIAAADVRTAPDDDSARMVVTGCSDGSVRMYAGPDLVPNGASPVDGKSPIVGVSIHPSGKYAISAAESGKIGFFSLDPSAAEENDGIKLVALLGEKGGEDEEFEYTCSSLHPDGLILGAGTKDGKLRIWDLKRQSLAGTLVCEGDPSPVSSLSFSENGYHFASSSLSGAVRVWDLRKLKCIATLNDGTKEEDKAKAVKAVAFDPSGKYVVYGGGEGGAAATIVPVKEWDKKTTVGGGGEDSASVVTGIVWASDASLLATCAEGERPVRFWGAPAEVKKEEE